MTSSYTTRKLILKQGTGDNTNTWGDQQSAGDFDVIDYAMDGWTSFDPTGNVTLTSLNATANATTNQAGARALKLITASATATTTIPGREGWYLVWNATTAAQTIASSGGGATVSILAGEIVFVMCDATNVKRLSLLTTTTLDLQGGKITTLGTPTNNSDAATKLYVDNTAFVQAAGSLPGQSGNAGKFLTTDGVTTASWRQPATTDLSDLSTFVATRNAFAVAMAIAL